MWRIIFFLKYGQGSNPASANCADTLTRENLMKQAASMKGRGFGEIARVARKRAVLLTWVPDAAPFWLTDDYFPEIAADDRKIFPDAAALTAMLERMIGPVHMAPVPIPHDCTDGLLCAYWRRPECYLDADRRGAMSSFARIDAEPGLARLRADLSSGLWAERNNRPLSLEALDAGYRILCCEIGDRAPRLRTEA